MPTEVYQISNIGIDAPAEHAGRDIVILSDGTLVTCYVKAISGNNEIFAASSTNNGLTWNEIQITSKGVEQRYPAIAVDASDNLHLSWSGKGWGTNSTYFALLYRKRTGGIWGSVTQIVDIDRTVGNSSICVNTSDSPRIAFDINGELPTPTSTYPRIYYTSADDSWATFEYAASGGLWTAWCNIDDMAIDGNGVPHIVFYAGGAAWTRPKIYYNARTRDVDPYWTYSGKPMESPTGDNEIYSSPSKRASIVISGTNVLVLYERTWVDPAKDTTSIEYNIRAGIGEEVYFGVTPEVVDRLVDNIRSYPCLVADKSGNLVAYYVAEGYSPNITRYNLCFKRRVSGAWTSGTLPTTSNSDKSLFIPGAPWSTFPTGTTNMPAVGSYYCTLYENVNDLYVFWPGITGSVSLDPLTRVTQLVRRFSAGPSPVYQLEGFLGGLSSEYFSPVANKKPIPTFTEKPYDPTLSIDAIWRWLATIPPATLVKIFGHGPPYTHGEIQTFLQFGAGGGF